MAKVGDRFLRINENGIVIEYEIVGYSPNKKKIKLRRRNPDVPNDYWYSGKGMKDWKIELL